MLKKLFVGNLSYKTTEEDIIDLFKQAGIVVSCNLILDKVTNRSRGFAFLEMSTQAEAKEAIEALNGREMDGRLLVVSAARPRNEVASTRGDLRRSWR